MKRTSFVVALSLVVGQTLTAQSRPRGTATDSQSVVIRAEAPPTMSNVRVDLPLVDAPYNTAHGLRAPSLAQSLAVTEGFYEVAHPAIERAFSNRPVLSAAALVVFDVFGSLLPGGDAWVHEEYHRAVLGNRGIGSFDDIYKLDLGASTVSVSHVKDEDLVRFKAEHPAEYVRAAEAGIEGENMLMQRLEKNRFFSDSRANNVVLLWLTKLNSYFYVASGPTKDTDDMTDEMNAAEGSDVAARDWVGHDFSAWVYDLHRPTEPYAARGVHPSGVGIDRYIKASDLTPEEHDFLAREGKLQLINFLDPSLIRFGGVTVRSPFSGGAMRLNASASHYLTSFGHSIDLNVFVRQGDAKLFVVAHRYTNGAKSFPGLEAEVVDVPLSLGGVGLEVSPRLSMWMQPEGQGFRTATSQVGGLAALRVRQATSSRVGIFAEISAKTEGWVAGEVQLERSVGVRVGGAVRVE